MPGAGRVGEDGAYRHVIPIELPQGINGLVPQLSLSYSSHAGNGPLGVGWTLHGASSRIDRCERVPAIDEYSDEVSFSQTDALCLDGVRLVAKSGEYGAVGTVYLTEQASWAKVTATASDTFEVRRPNGTIAQYEAVKRIRDIGSGSEEVIAFWALSHVVDRHMNSIAVTYDGAWGEGNPVGGPAQDAPAIADVVEIWYGRTRDAGSPYEGARGIRIHWRDRPDPISEERAGVTYKTGERISQIEVLSATASGEVRPIRSYYFRYEESAVTRRSLLVGIRVCDGNYDCLPETTFDWTSSLASESPGLAEELEYEPYYVRTEDGENPLDPLPVERCLAYRHVVYDANGDGRDDLVYEEGTPPVPKLLLSNGSGFDAPIVVPVQAGSSNNLNLSDAFVADFDGDGEQELLARVGQELGSDYMPEYSPWYNGAYGLFRWDESAGTLALESAGLHPNQFIVAVGDMDSDGRADAVARDKDGKYLSLWLSNSNGFLSTPRHLPQAEDEDPFDPQPPCAGGPSKTAYALTTLDRDGKADLTISCPEKEEGSYVVELANDGTPIGRRMGLNLGTKLLADFSGDGLVDALDRDPNYELSSEYAWTNRGGYFTRFYSPLPEGVDNTRGRVFDINRDGIADFLSNDRRSVFVAAPGNAFELNKPPEERQKAVFFPGLGNIHRDSLDIKFGDTDGNGRPEVFVGAASIIVGSNVSCRRSLSVFRPTKTEPIDLIEEVIDGVDATERVSYEPLLNDGSTEHYVAGNCEHPQKCVKSGMFVAAHHFVDSGVTGAEREYVYRYEDARIDAQGRGFLGFKCIEVDDVARSSTTRTCHADPEYSGYVFEQRDKACPGYFYPHIGLPTDSVTTIPLLDGTGRVRIIETKHEYYDARWFDAASYDVNPRSTTVTTYEGPEGSEERVASTRTEYVWDYFGNLTESTTTVYDGNDQVVERERFFGQYTNDEGRWILGQSTREERQVERDGLAESVVSYTRDPETGLVASITHNAGMGSSYESTTTLIRDPSVGVVTGVESVASGEPTRVYEFGYDQDWIHAVWTMDPIGAESWRVYRDGLDVVAFVQNHEGHSAVFDHDGFGRIVAVTDPSGIRSTQKILAHSELPSILQVQEEVAYAFRLEKPGSPTRYSLADRLGRPVVDWVEMPSGWARYDRSWDKRGRLVRRRAPGEPDEVRVWEYTLDNLDRLNELTRPNQSTVQVEYPDFFTSVETAATGRVRQTTTDVLGNPVEVTVGGNETTTYKYTAGGIKEIVQGNGLKWVMDYDQAGRLSRSDDPHHGPWEYEYDGFDQLRTQKGGQNGVVGRRSYFDELGRVYAEWSSEAPGDGFSWFVWDTAVNGVGRIHETTSVQGVTQRWHYDSAGRNIQIDTESTSGVLSRGVAFDSYGRLERIDYATAGDPFAVVYEYGQHGWLSQARAGANVIWSVAERHPDGTIAEEELGGEAIKYSFTKGMRWLEDATLESSSTQLFRNSFKPSGQLDGRKLVNGTEESFDYDSHTRLERYSVTAGPGAPWVDDLDYSYGNIDDWEKTRPGSASQTIDFSYGTGPTGIDEVLKSYTGSDPFTYDATGRQTSNGAAEATFGDLLVPFSAHADSTDIEFEYDSAGQKVERRVGSDFTLYEGGLTELVSNSEGVTETFRIYAGGRQVAEVVRTEGGLRNRYLVSDGSDPLIVLENGQVNVPVVWSPYGEVVDGTPDGIRSYHGMEYDELLGVFHAGARLYDPRQGRFTAPDPLATNVYEPSTLSGYAWAGNDPVNRTDPEGLGYKPKIGDYVDNKNPSPISGSEPTLTLPGVGGYPAPEVTLDLTGLGPMGSSTSYGGGGGAFGGHSSSAGAGYSSGGFTVPGGSSPSWSAPHHGFGSPGVNQYGQDSARSQAADTDYGMNLLWGYDERTKHEARSRVAGTEYAINRALFGPDPDPERAVRIAADFWNAENIRVIYDPKRKEKHQAERYYDKKRGRYAYQIRLGKFKYRPKRHRVTARWVLTAVHHELYHVVMRHDPGSAHRARQEVDAYTRSLGIGNALDLQPYWMWELYHRREGYRDELWFCCEALIAVVPRGQVLALEVDDARSLAGPNSSIERLRDAGCARCPTQPATGPGGRIPT